MDKNRTFLMDLRLRGATAFRNPLQFLTSHGILPRQVWKRIPAVGSFRVDLPNGSSFCYTSSENDGVGRALFWRGWSAWEPETISLFYQLAKQASVVLDIGSNTGLYTLVACAANPSVNVIAFEPLPTIFNVLEHNVEQNGWRDRCRLVNSAVSENVGSGHLHVPFREVPLSASLDTTGFRGFDGHIIDVEIVSIDSVLEKCSGVDLVKIDAEGYDDKVLMGMSNVLEVSRPIIFVECNVDGPYRQVEEILTAYGYRFFFLDTRGIREVEHIRPEQDRIYQNFACAVVDLTEVPRV